MYHNHKAYNMVFDINVYPFDVRLTSPHVSTQSVHTGDPGNNLLFVAAEVRNKYFCQSIVY